MGIDFYLIHLLEVDKLQKLSDIEINSKIKLLASFTYVLNFNRISVLTLVGIHEEYDIEIGLVETCDTLQENQISNNSKSM